MEFPAHRNSIQPRKTRRSLISNFTLLKKRKSLQLLSFPPPPPPLPSSFPLSLLLTLAPGCPSLPDSPAGPYIQQECKISELPTSRYACILSLSDSMVLIKKWDLNLDHLFKLFITATIAKQSICVSFGSPFVLSFQFFLVLHHLHPLPEFPVRRLVRSLQANRLVLCFQGRQPHPQIPSLPALP